jgi:steroid delta-isomerase-like uncharacterized protein
MKKLFLVLTIAAMFTACNCSTNKNNATDALITQNKADIGFFCDQLINKHNVAIIDSLVAPDYTVDQVEPGYPATRDGYKKMMADFFKSFPDLNEKVNFMVADSSNVAIHYTLTGTNTAPMMGMPATGKKINIDGVDIFRMKNHKIVKQWEYDEEVKMMTQMGMMPDMSAPKDTNKTMKPDGDKAMKDKK